MVTDWRRTLVVDQSEGKSDDPGELGSLEVTVLKGETSALIRPRSSVPDRREQDASLLINEGARSRPVTLSGCCSPAVDPSGERSVCLRCAQDAWCLDNTACGIADLDEYDAAGKSLLHATIPAPSGCTLGLIEGFTADGTSLTSYACERRAQAGAPAEKRCFLVRIERGELKTLGERPCAGLLTGYGRPPEALLGGEGFYLPRRSARFP